ncbi:hypothetical protein AMTRI_Chr01g135120 [Amborella trichopoda]
MYEQAKNSAFPNFLLAMQRYLWVLHLFSKSVSFFCEVNFHPLLQVFINIMASFVASGEIACRCSIVVWCPLLRAIRCKHTLGHSSCVAYSWALTLFSNSVSFFCQVNFHPLLWAFIKLHHNE